MLVIVVEREGILCWWKEKEFGVGNNDGKRRNFVLVIMREREGILCW